MYQYDDPSAVLAMPAPPPPARPGFFSDGNPLQNVQGTRVDAHFLNVLMVELLTVLAAANITPDRTQTGQVLQAIEVLIAQGSAALAKMIPSFTAVQQGGGHNQGADKVFVGWRSDGSGLGVTVDATDLGNVVFEAELAGVRQQLQSEVTGIQQQVAALQGGGATSGFQFGAVGTYVMGVPQTWQGGFWGPGGLQNLAIGQQVANIWAITSVGNDGYANQYGQGNGASQQMAGTWVYLGGMEMDMGSAGAASAGAGLFVRIA